jgi:molybdopterin-guanine dinucleotide biosynthesis protein MobB
MKVCGIVGWKNSGKTFFAQELINHFTKKNFIVASIKHAHHIFDIDRPGTDSFLHRKAGSQQVIVSSSKRWAKIIEIGNRKEKKLNDLLKELESPDIVIVEGFKNELHPKIEIIKESTNDFLFMKLKNVIGIVSNTKIDSNIVQFKRSEIDNIAEHILNNTG